MWISTARQFTLRFQFSAASRSLRRIVGDVGRDAGADAGVHLPDARDEGQQHLQAAGRRGEDRPDGGKLRPQQHGRGSGWIWMPFISAIFALSHRLAASRSLLGLWAPTADVSVTAGVGADRVHAHHLLIRSRPTDFLRLSQGLLPAHVPDGAVQRARRGVHADLDGVPSLRQRRVRLWSSRALVYAALIVANHALFGLLPGAWSADAARRTSHSWPVGVPAVLSLYFDWFSSVMQAFIFCMLTMMYISTATD